MEQVLTVEMINEISLMIKQSLVVYYDLMKLDNKLINWINDNSYIDAFPSVYCQPWLNHQLAYDTEICLAIANKYIVTTMPNLMNNLNQLSKQITSFDESEKTESKNGYAGFDLTNQDGQFSGVTIETTKTNPNNVFKYFKTKIDFEFSNMLDEILNRILITIW